MQFNPLVFLVKLYIELNLAEMIARIVKTSPLPPSPPPMTMPGLEVLWGSKLETYIQGGRRSSASLDHGEERGIGSTTCLDPPQSGIMKTGKPPSISIIETSSRAKGALANPLPRWSRQWSSRS